MQTTLKPDSEHEEELNPSHRDYGEKFLQDFEHRAVLSEEELAARRAKHTKKGEGDSEERVRNLANKEKTDNGFYTPPSSTRSSQGQGRGRLGKKGGVLGILGLLAFLGGLSLSLLMLPLKIPGVLQSIADETGQRVEHISEMRAKRLLARIILGQTATGGDKFIITGSGPVATLAATMRANNFEKKLADRGLEIRKVDGGVRLIHNGKELGGKGGLKNVDAVVKALESDNLSRAMLKDVIKEEIPTWRWLKRAKIKRWISLRYHIPRFGIDNSNKDSDKEKIKEMQQARLTAGYDRVSDSVEEAISCYAGKDCPEQIDGSAGHTKDAKSEDGKRQAKEAGQLLTEEAVKKTSTQPVTKVVITSFSEQITKLVSSKAYSAIPIVGQIVGLVDTAALFHHVAHKAIDNDYFSQVPAYFRAMSYAQMYAEWQGYADQIKAGEMDMAMVGVLSTQLNGLEESRAHHYLQGDASTGTPIKHRINSNKPSSYIDEMRTILDLMDAGSFAPLTIGFSKLGININKVLPGHYVLNLWYDYIGQSLEYVAGKVIDGVGWLIPDSIADSFMNFLVGSLEKWAGSLVSGLMDKMLPLLGVVVDPLDSGADLMNDLHAGATVTYNNYCEEQLGCRKLTSAQAYEQNRLIAQERTEYAAAQPLAYRVWNQDNPQSFVNQLAIRTPTGENPVTTTATAVGTLLGSLPQRLFSLISPATSADTGYVDLYGVDPYGATATDLDQPVSEQAISGEPCPEVAEGEYDNCKVDSAIAEAMICNFTPEDAKCGNEVTATSAQGSSFRIATFNVLGESHDDAGSPQYKERMDSSIAVMTENNLQIVGLQEFQKPQWDYFMSKMRATYGIYPTNPSYGRGSSPPSVNSIIYDKQKFSLQDGGMMPGLKYFNGSKLSAPWVMLKDNATGQLFYVLNTHDPAKPMYAQYRYENAKQHVNFIRSLRSKGFPIFFTGDFNSGFSLRSEGNTTYQDKAENLTYCILSADGSIRNAYDVAKDREFSCPNPGNGNSIDHIYVSNGVEVTKYFTIERGKDANGSDHATHIADVIIPGNSDIGGAGWVWPIKPPVHSGPCFGGSSVHAGIDINTTSDSNPALAAHGGEVYRVGSGGAAGNYVMIRTNDDKYYYSYQHLRSISVEEGDRVEAGQQVGIVGLTGNTNVAATTKGHLHMVVATAPTLGSYGNLTNLIDPMKVLPAGSAPGGYKCTE